jgi:hypothetical protein
MTIPEKRSAVKESEAMLLVETVEEGMM